MDEQTASDLQAELAALRQRLGNLEAEHRERLRRATRARRPAFSRKFLLSAIPVALLLAAGGVLYAVDALNIDNKGNATFIGNLGIGTSTTPSEKLQVSGGKIQLDGNQQVKFTDTDTTNNLKVQLWSGFGLGINAGTLFYAANDTHSWRDNTGTNEWMALKTGANGGLTVKGTASFAGKVNADALNFTTSEGRQMVNLWNSYHGIGVQSLTTYFRSAQNFAWYKGGTHSGTELDAGTNGTPQMVIKDGNVGIGTTDPKDKLDVVGPLRILSDSNPIRFTSKYSGFPDGAGVTTQAEISNDTDTYKSLMIVGNKSGGGTTRRVQVYDQLEVKGALYVDGWINNIHQGGYRRLESIGSIVRGHDAVWTEDTYSSDNRLKSEIYPVPSALEKVRKLRGVRYLWNQEALDYFTSDIEKTISAGPDATREANRALWQKEREKRYKELSKTNVGVIAQEVEAVLPEAVTTDEKGYKSVRYHYLIPLLIEALKEQDKAVKEQAQTVARQQAEIERLAVAQQTVQTQLAELAAVKAQLARVEAALQRDKVARASVVPDLVRQLFTTQAK